MKGYSTLANGFITLLVALGLAACGGGGGGGPYGGNGSMIPASSSSSSSAPTASSFMMTALVSDGGVSAPHADTHMKNTWGVAFNPNGFVWVTNADSDTSTLYDGNGVPQTLVVNVPGNPVGIVFNGGGGFTVKKGVLSGSSAFIFAGEGGTISGWSPGVDATNAITAYDGSASSASYRGLALASKGGANFLYAADFHNGRIDVFDTNFARTTTTGGFADATLPAGYAPFGLQAIGGKLYVTFAKVDTATGDEITGAGLGILDVFDTDGKLLQRLVTGGALNAPWGIAMAPANFGSFSNDILVSNFGDGKINAYNPTSGAMVGTLSQANGSPIVIDGLWGIAFGNDRNNQPSNTLFFAAGPNDEANGEYGRIDLR
ncbi:MAG TPA: TIGR03118 family protein [Rhodocyclaceae bacterium]|nr:TIGR03118 family protein [Rhodocyclaceae bacterium]